jgi:hypothetical protein
LNLKRNIFFVSPPPVFWDCPICNTCSALADDVKDVGDCVSLSSSPSTTIETTGGTQKWKNKINKKKKSSKGDSWKERHAVLKPLMKGNNLRNHLHHINDKASELCALMAGSSEQDCGGSDVMGALKSFTVDVVAHFVFGTSPSSPFGGGGFCFRFASGERGRDGIKKKNVRSDVRCSGRDLGALSGGDQSFVATLDEAVRLSFAVILCHLSSPLSSHTFSLYTHFYRIPTPITPVSSKTYKGDSASPRRCGRS